jgi:hypothetical protein
MEAIPAPVPRLARWRTWGRRLAVALVSWRRLTLTIAAFLLVPAFPQVRAALPIEQTALMLVAVIAVYSIVGWMRGGSAQLAILWIVLAAVFFLDSDMPTTGSYTWLARGWILVVAASFGLVSIVVAGDAFLSRALSALAISFALAFGVVLVSTGGMDRASSAMTTEINRRVVESNTLFRESLNTPEWKQLSGKTPGVDVAGIQEEELAFISKWSVVLVPALAALESLAALALGWSVYHKMSHVEIGPPLGKFRDFKFNDQLVWGVAVGASIFLLKAFADGRNAGLNLLVFFGFLYALRGAAIISWLARSRLTRAVLVLAAITWPMWVLAFGIGLGDTWLNFRSRMQTKQLT